MALFFVTFQHPTLPDEFDQFIRAASHEHALQLWLDEVKPYGIKGWTQPAAQGPIQVFPVPDPEGDHGSVPWPHREKKSFSIILT